MTDDIAEAAKHHRKTIHYIKQSRERKEQRLAKRHTIEDISYKEDIRVKCSCGWAVGAETSILLERLWKLHKSTVGEKNG